MLRFTVAYALAAVAMSVTATSSRTACCSSLLSWLQPSESCCHGAGPAESERRTECDCCTDDNRQPLTAPAAPELAPAADGLAIAPAEPATRPLSLTSRSPVGDRPERPPPHLTASVVLLI